jgi:hypothetical protein
MGRARTAAKAGNCTRRLSKLISASRPEARRSPAAPFGTAIPQKAKSRDHRPQHAIINVAAGPFGRE